MTRLRRPRWLAKWAGFLLSAWIGLGWGLSYSRFCFVDGGCVIDDGHLYLRFAPDNSGCRLMDDHARIPATDGSFPLWPILMLAVIPTIILFWRDRRILPVGPAGTWLDCPGELHCPEERKRRSLAIIRDTVAELCRIPPASISPLQPIGSLWEAPFDGGELLEILKTRLCVSIEIDWWQAQFGGKDGMSFGEFAERLATYIQTRPPTCRCGYNLTGNTSGVCPECHEATP